MEETILFYAVKKHEIMRAGHFWTGAIAGVPNVYCYALVVTETGLSGQQGTNRPLSRTVVKTLMAVVVVSGDRVFGEEEETSRQYGVLAVLVVVFLLGGRQQLERQLDDVWASQRDNAFC